MERFNFQAIEKKWQKIFASKKLKNTDGKSSIVLKCFRTHQGRFIWVMLEIIQLEM